LHVLLHCNLLQVMYMLRLGKVKELTKQSQPPPGQPGQGPAPADMDGPDTPPPPILQHLDTTLDQLAAALAQQQQQQQGAVQGGSPVATGAGTGVSAAPAAAAAAALPYSLAGFPSLSLEPLVCLVGALVLRGGCMRPRLTDRYLERGLLSVSRLLALLGVRPLPGASGGAEGGAAEGEGDADTEQGEGCLPPQCLEGARWGLVLQLLLLECRAQVLLSKAELSSAREDVLRCQQLAERYPHLLAAHLPGLHALTGQYCVATGELPAAAAHFEFARTSAPSRPAAALAA
ncbi:hypothetical protein Agub_g5176, partial [Astrephomene gubernaculifera]